MITMKADLSAFRAALRAVIIETKKPEADIVNKAMKDVAFRAAQFTPKTSPGMIRRQLTLKREGLLVKLASIACNNKYGKHGWNRAQHSAMMLAIITRRVAGAAALRAGWIPAIIALGGSYRGATARSGGSVAKGGAQKATIGRLIGVIKNTAVTASGSKRTKRGAGEISKSVAALFQAVQFVTRDRMLYAERKRAIGAVLEKHSDH